MRKKKALIIGISGQDGAYLARLLILKGYAVIGTSRDVHTTNFTNLDRLNIRHRVTLVSLSLLNFENTQAILKKYTPDEVYNLSGQSSIQLSFIKPFETVESIFTCSYNLLEAVRLTNKEIRIFNAGSGEVFGNTIKPADESTQFKPRNPYAIAKATSFWQFANYREAYNLFACTGILFNHESPLRPLQFVTQKIIHGAREIASGKLKSLALGNLEIVRDWGWAPEYVEAIWLMMQKKAPDDYIIATGKSYSLVKFTELAFAFHGLDWRKYVSVDKNLFRPLDTTINIANPTKAKNFLNWESKMTLEQIVVGMIREQV